jgi:hypothetical protein
VDIYTNSSAYYRSVQGQLQRTKKQVTVRGLNRDCNHDLKNLFESAVITACDTPAPMAESVTLSLSKCPASWRWKLASESTCTVKAYQPKDLCSSL